MKYVVVPERLSINSDQIPRPSFVFRQVISYLAQKIKENDEVFFAPANNFGLVISEQEAGKRYLESICKINHVNIHSKNHTGYKYMDTLDNAIYLKKQFPELVLNQIELVTTNLHSKRVYYCFKSIGFSIAKLHSVEYKILKENIVKRLWYYKYPNIHKMYEKLALIKNHLDIYLMGLKN